LAWQRAASFLREGCFAQGRSPCEPSHVHSPGLSLRALSIPAESILSAGALASRTSCFQLNELGQQLGFIAAAVQPHIETTITEFDPCQPDIIDTVTLSAETLQQM
jgi:hypothetical protein